MTKTELWADPEWCAQNWGNRNGKPWTSEEFTQAVTMRLAGHSNAEIASELNRTERSIEGKIGYVRS